MRRSRISSASSAGSAARPNPAPQPSHQGSPRPALVALVLDLAPLAMTGHATNLLQEIDQWRRDDRGLRTGAKQGTPAKRPASSLASRATLADVRRAWPVSSREQVGDDGTKLVKYVVAVLEDKKASPKLRLEAATWLADRGFGRPRQAVDLAVDEQGPILVKFAFDPDDPGTA